MWSDTMSQLAHWLTKCAPKTDLLNLVFTLPRALRDVEQLVGDPNNREKACHAVKAFGYDWHQTALDPERAEHRALAQAFYADAITRLVDGEAWSHTLAEQLRTVAAAHKGTTTGTWAGDAARDLQTGLGVARQEDTSEPGSSAA